MPNKLLNELMAQGYEVKFKHQTFPLGNFKYPEILINVSRGKHHVECVFDSDILLDEEYLKIAIQSLVRQVNTLEAENG